ncbi:MAG: hypothetical protein GY696_09345 [Gammaproteobacteria bacterium]|nr:hypothetical protein [Gammaproteobacteria bacterium]
MNAVLLFRFFERSHRREVKTRVSSCNIRLSSDFSHFCKQRRPKTGIFKLQAAEVNGMKLVVIFVTVCCAKVEAGGIFNVEIAADTLTTVPYGDVNLAVWQHVYNVQKSPRNRTYYAMPLVLLRPDKAKCSFAALARKHLLRLHLLMWSEDVQNAVAMHLRYRGNLFGTFLLHVALHVTSL